MSKKLQRNQSIIDFLVTNIFYPKSSCESEEFHRAFCKKIKELNPASASFDTDWKQLILGGVVAGIVIYSTKYGYKDYPYDLLGLMTRCGAKPAWSYCNGEILDRVPEMGRQILNKTLPFEFDHISILNIGRHQGQIKILLAELVKEHNLDDNSRWLNSLAKLTEDKKHPGFFTSKKNYYSISTNMPVDGKHVSDEAMAMRLCPTRR